MAQAKDATAKSGGRRLVVVHWKTLLLAAALTNRSRSSLVWSKPLQRAGI